MQYKSIRGRILYTGKKPERHDNFTPMDCSVRLTVGNHYQDTCWVRFADGCAECESFNVRDGRIV